MKRLAGRVAVVTGAASGIGASSAALFLGEGARVLAVDRSPLAEAALDPDPDYEFLLCDIAEPGGPETIVARAIEAFGGLDILFNNAGVAGAGPLAETTDQSWDRINDVNLKAVFRLTRAAAGSLKASRAGRVSPRPASWPRPPAKASTHTARPSPAWWD
jgi:NAD(P)-dependent dehydrogenase (short-subunit alcohol dehydrogenase family)